MLSIDWAWRPDPTQPPAVTPETRCHKVWSAGKNTGAPVFALARETRLVTRNFCVFLVPLMLKSSKFLTTAYVRMTGTLRFKTGRSVECCVGRDAH
jgi:hypothetical protein